jgi:arylsulfatase A-like enzyme
VAEHLVLVVWDGMRADCVTPELTPTLWQLRTNGVWSDRHHSAWPTSTEVNGATLATGAYPGHSGILANNEFRPAINASRPFGTQDIDAVRKGDEITGGHYLAVPTLAELVQQRGQRTAVAGSKPVAILLDRAVRTGDDAPGLVVFGDRTLPSAAWSGLTKRLGAQPESRTPNTARDEWTARCLTEAFWEKGVPKFSVLWLSEPDATQHKYGPGSEPAREAIRGCDRNLDRLLRELDRRGLRATTDVLVVSDHGFSTDTGNADVAAALRQSGLKISRRLNNPPADGDILLVGNGGYVMIYVNGHATNVVREAVTALQRQPFAGVIFTRDGFSGTFPLSEVRLDAPHAPDIVMSLRWQPGGNKDGLPGLVIKDTTGSTSSLGGTHGTLCPTDLHNICVASGPDFRAGVTNQVPSGNVDVVPTLLWLLGIPSTQPADGRVLFETLTAGGARPPRIEQRKLEAHANLSDGVWTQYLSIAEVNGVRYFDAGNGEFVPDAKPR